MAGSQQGKGFITSLDDARLAWLSGAAYPAPPAGVFLALYAGAVPNQDGTLPGGYELTAGGARPAITFGAPQTDASGRRYITHAAPITFTVPGNVGQNMLTGWGICAAASGGTPQYVAPYGGSLFAPGIVLTWQAGFFKVYAEGTALLGLMG